MRSINKRLFRMIKDTKGQFIAVSAVLAVGLIIFMSLNISAANLESNMLSFYNNYNFADLTCEADGVSRRQIQELEDVAGVRTAEGRLTSIAPLPGDESGRAKVKILTVSPDMAINNLLLDEGDLLTEGSREIMVIRQFAAARGLKPGDSLKLQINGRALDFQIAAIVLSPEFVYLSDPEQGFIPDNANYGIVYMDEWLGQRLLGGGSNGASGRSNTGSIAQQSSKIAYGIAGNRGTSGNASVRPIAYNEVLIELAPGLPDAEIDAVADEINDRLDNYGAKGIVKQESQLSNALLQTEITQLNNMSTALPMLFLLIAALILAMMLGRMVKRDRQPIGIMKALGYSTGDLIMHYVKYSLLVALAGGAAGSVLGLGLAVYLTDFYMVYFNLPSLSQDMHYQFLAFSVLLSCAFCITSGFMGARGIAKINPAESMIQEAPRAGKRIMLERVGFLWRQLSFSGKMAMKNTFRNKKRSVFIFTGVAISFSLMVFVLSMPTAMDDMMGAGLAEFQTMDYNVNFRRPTSERVIFDIPYYLSETDEIESKVESPFKLSNAQHEISLNLVGVAPDTIFYNFKTKGGLPVAMPEDGLLISDYAAMKLGVAVGDRVLLHSYLTPDKDDVWVEVSGIIYQAMGVGAYMDKSLLSRDFLSPGTATGCYINSDDPNAASSLMQLPVVSSVVSTGSLESMMQEYTAILNITMFFMLALSGLLGFAIVYNTTIISIGERETEFSSLRVLGFSRGDIFRLVLKENNLIAVLGILAGVPLANLFLLYSADIFSTEQYTMVMRAGLVNYLQGIAVTAFFIMLAQFATYKKIRGLDFMAALKNRA